MQEGSPLVRQDNYRFRIEVWSNGRMLACKGFTFEPLADGFAEKMRTKYNELRKKARDRHEPVTAVFVRKVRL